MYPNLYFFFLKTFGVEISWLRFINTFGFFVALSFFAAYWLFQKELIRKQNLGMFIPSVQEEEIGKPASAYELLVQFFIGFLLGYKMIGLFMHSSMDSFNPQHFIFSTQGSVLGGIAVGFLFASLKWFEKNKQKLPQPKTVSISIYPKDRANDILSITFVFTFIGAKLFHNLENWDTFIKDPIGEMLSFGGLTFYGGLIVAIAACYVYLRRHKISFLPMFDAVVPGLMLAYAIGRLGCQFSGDGDWGILNSAYISNIDAQVVTATPEQFQQALINNANYYTHQFDSLSQVPHYSFTARLLPTYLVAQNYPNNVISEGFNMTNCGGLYCAYLPISVFPTPLYESLMSFCLFFVLWRMRKRIKYTGQLSAIYLVLSGSERLLIEQIRVNNLYHIGGLAFTQAELIAVIFIIGGVFWYRYSFKKQFLIPTKSIV